MEKKTKKYLLIGASALALGTMLVLILKKRNQANLYSPWGSLATEDMPVVQEPDLIKDTITRFFNTLTQPQAGTRSLSAGDKILSPGLRGDLDVKLLQVLINRISDDRKAQGRPYLGVLQVNGNLAGSTAGAMQYYFGTLGMSIAELNERISLLGSA